jgi:hypothetical protein
MRPSIHQIDAMGNVFAPFTAGDNCRFLLRVACSAVLNVGIRDGADALTELIRSKPTRAPHQPGPFRVARSRTGLGLFATEPIRKGKFIIEYWGERVRWSEVGDEDQNRYYFDLNTRWAIDGADRRNTARYVNHSCKPNAEPYEVRGKIKIYARRGIKPGEEITYDYGKEYFDEFLAPIGCKCEACRNGGGRTNPPKRRRARRAAKKRGTR